MPTKEIFVITGTEVKDTGKVSFAFQMKDGVPFDRFSRQSGTYGWLRLRPKGPDEIELRSLGKGKSIQVGDDGTLRWEVFVFEAGRGQIMTASGPEDSKNDPDESLLTIVRELPSCVLLMSQEMFPRFKKACDYAPDVTLGVHHHEGQLATA